LVWQIYIGEDIAPIWRGDLVVAQDPEALCLAAKVVTNMWYRLWAKLQLSADLPEWTIQVGELFRV
jgi:hypothetical protein